MTQEQQPKFVYQPESLGRIIDSAYAGKRLKNRTGHAIAMDESGTLKWAARGRILDVNSAAKAFSVTDPNLLFE